MKKLWFKAAVYLVIGLTGAGVFYCLAIMSWTDNPEGMYASYKLAAHHKFDVVRFRNGQVKKETCCGDQDWGTYYRDSTGRWIWDPDSDDKIGHKNDRPLNRVFLRRSLFFLDLQFENEPATQIRLRSRLFSNSLL